MDILSAATIELRCNDCGGTYEISLKQVELSQEALHAGCQAQGENECYPIIYASLMDGALIDDLQQTWHKIEEGVRRAGGRLLLHAG
ncbi:MAG: hypothetical protein Q7T82_07980 [Armatimonadota bacterium]|nr:hypothetical protein [Armatimonadota bacterium]